MSSTMSSPNPVTPDRGLTARNVYRRSVTAPLGFNTPTRQSQAAVEIGAAEGIETLYTHPSAKVVSFSTAGSRHTSRPNSSSEGPGSIGQSDAGLLPWNNSSDRTLAAGESAFNSIPDTGRRLTRYRSTGNISSPRICIIPPLWRTSARNPTPITMLVR